MGRTCRKFVSELHRVTLPGGKVIICTWCHRNLLAGEATLKPNEQVLLDRINEAYYLPPWCSLHDYEVIFGVSTPP
jgi:tocopherol O-methyltransferase